MNNIHQQTSQEFLVSVIGRNYVESDCYEVTKDFYNTIFNINLSDLSYEDPDNMQEVEGLFNIESLKFQKVKDRKFGDIIVFRVLGLASHIGVYLEGRKFLHTTKKTDCIIDDLAKWERRIVGFYRWPSLDTV